MRDFFILSIAFTLVLCGQGAFSADLSKGQGIYMNFCASCHDSGIAGAPKLGDTTDWQKRLSKGEDTLISNAINGFQGETGFMPAKGGMSSLSDEEVASAVKYMIAPKK